MAQKTLHLSSNPKHYGIIGGKTVNGKYGNLTLNCNHFNACSDIVCSKANVKNEYKTKIISNSGKKLKAAILKKRDSSIKKLASVNSDFQGKKDSIFWKKASNNLSTIFSKDAFCDSYKKKELNEGNDSTSAKNSSTLSLHIAAYEDSIEASAPPLDEGNESKSDLCQKWNNGKQILASKESFAQNPYEFPRQQENGEGTSKPEVAQFKASQKLLNPNESMASNQAEKVTSSFVLPSRSLIQRGVTSMMGLFGKTKDPKDHVREMTRKMRSEMTKLDRQINQIQRKEEQIKREIKMEAKKGNKDACLILAKGLIHSRRAVGKMYMAKTQINSAIMGMQHQLATMRMAGSIQSSNEVMQAMQKLVKVPEIMATMRELSKEMTKAGIITEMIEETMESMEPEELEDQAAKEVDKVLWEVTEGQLGQAPEAITDNFANEEDEKFRQQADALVAQLEGAHH